MVLVCPFFLHNSGNTSPERLERVLYILNKFKDSNSKFHTIKLVTDLYTHTLLDFLEFDSVEYIDSADFKYVDDSKVSLLPLLNEDEILIDYDVFLLDSLKVDNSYDIIIERYEEPYAESIYRGLIDKITDTDIQRYFIGVENLHRVPNIGILKINNLELLQQYIKTYNSMSREYLHTLVDPSANYRGYSVLFGQLVLQDLLNRGKYRVYDCKTKYCNKYTHLNGDRKYSLSKSELDYKIISYNLI